MWSLLVLIGQKQQHKHTPHTQTRTRHKFCVQILATAIQKTTNQPPVNSTQPENVAAVIAAGKRPAPSRTRKLSLPAPMVLHSTGCGRVGNRRTTNQTTTPAPKRGPRHLSWCNYSRAVFSSSAMSVKTPSTPQDCSSRARCTEFTVQTFICRPAAFRRETMLGVKLESSG